MRLTRSTCAIWVLAIAAILLTSWTTVRETRRWRISPFGDFNNLQTGGECLIAGCDPYDFAALNREAARRHEHKPEIWPMSPVYPTSSLIVLLPFEGLGWPTAAYLFNALAGLATAMACAMIIWTLRIRVWDPAAVPLLASLICIPMVTAIEFANPALLDAAMIAIACVLLLELHFRTMGWVLLGIALALKPQLAIGAAMVLLWRQPTRAAALKAGALALALLLMGLIGYRLRLGSFHFLSSLRYALWLSAMPQGLADFENNEAYDFLNLQITLAAIHTLSRTAINLMTWLTTVSIAGAAMAIGRMRCAVNKRPWTMIGLATAISVLPIYHRGYDRVIALVLLPVAVELAQTSKWLAWLYAAVLTLWIANDTIMAHIVRRWQYTPQSPVEDIVLCCIMLVGLSLLPRRPAAEKHVE